MSQLTAELVTDVVAACQASGEAVAVALSRAFDTAFSLVVCEAVRWTSGAPPNDLDGGGLLVEFVVGDASAVVLLPSVNGLVPDWVQLPDADGSEKLSTLAHELSKLLIPKSLAVDTSRAAWVSNLLSSLEASTIASDATLVPLLLSRGEQQARMLLLWPVTEGDRLFEFDNDETADEATMHDQPTGDHAVRHLPYRPGDFSELPPYARHLLKVSVPVSVQLVGKKQTVREITRLVPGAIINFDKSCDAPLELLVNNRLAARGETVKVGERFGLLISEMVLPPESFAAVKKRPAS